MASDDKSRFNLALSRWVRVFLSRRTAEDIDYHERQIWVPGDTAGSMTTISAPILRWSFEATRAARETDEWKSLERAAAKWKPLSSHLGKMLGADGTGLMRCDLEMLLPPFVPAPRWDVPTSAAVLPTFEQEKLSELFARFAHFLEADELVYIVKTVLVGLRIDEPLLPIDLTPDVTIAKMSSEEVEQFGGFNLIQTPYGQPHGLYAWPESPWLALYWTRHLKKQIVDGRDVKPHALDREIVTRLSAEFERVHESLLQALALQRHGVVGLGGSSSALADWPFGGTSLTRPRTEAPDIFSAGVRNMALTVDDVRSLPPLFQRLLTRNADDALSIALRRLTYAMENKRPEDRLLDGMMAAEAIFGQDSSNEMTYRISLRIAFATAPTDSSKRRRAFDLMKRAYGVRSRVVHGGTVDSKKLVVAGKRVSIDVFVAAVEDLIRDAARVAVQKTNGKFRVEPWDEIILEAPSARK